jgi:hypothetical protein
MVFATTMLKSTIKVKEIEKHQQVPARTRRFGFMSQGGND